MSTGTAEELARIAYDLAKKFPDMQGRGFVIGTSYGELEVSADEGRAITLAVKRLLERRRARAIFRALERC